MSDVTRIIFGAPYVFARKKLRKPLHVQLVTISGRGVLCHNGCGLYYVAPTPETMEPGDVCPDCDTPPKPWTIATEVEDLEVSVKMVFGNIVDMEIVRALGPLAQRRTINLPIFKASVEPSK